MSEISDYLRELRGKKSLRAVQKDTGISHTYLNSLEKGVDRRSNKKINPSQEVLKQLADYYKVSYAELLEKAGHTQGVSNSKGIPDIKFNGKNLFPVKDEYFFVENNPALGSQKVLIETGETNFINLWENENLVEEFSLVNPDDEKQVLNFIKNYGKLGRESLPMTLKVKDHANTYVEVFEQETLEWIQIHIRTVKLVMALLPLIKVKDVDSIITTIRAEEIDEGSNNKFVRVGNLSGYTKYGLLYLELEPMHIGLELIKTVLNYNSQSIKREFINNNGKLESHLTCDTLLEIIYWQLGNTVQSEGGTGHFL